MYNSNCYYYDRAVHISVAVDMRTLLDRNNFSSSSNGQVAAHRVTGLIINRLRFHLRICGCQRDGTGDGSGSHAAGSHAPLGRHAATTEYLASLSSYVAEIGRALNHQACIIVVNLYCLHESHLK